MDEALAREVLLDHFKNPRRRGALAGESAREGVNPACGDRVELTAALKDGRWDLMVRGSGCVISQASASMMAQALQGRDDADARVLAAAVRSWVTGKGPKPDLSGLEDLEALAGVRTHPSRARCAGLAWNLFLEGGK
jgi:nitrogen fixation protein NifU and related proteins